MPVQPPPSPLFKSNSRGAKRPPWPVFSYIHTYLVHAFQYCKGWEEGEAGNQHTASRLRHATKRNAQDAAPRTQTSRPDTTHTVCQARPASRARVWSARRPVSVLVSTRAFWQPANSGQPCTQQVSRGKLSPNACLYTTPTRLRPAHPFRHAESYEVCMYECLPGELGGGAREVTSVAPRVLLLLLSEPLLCSLGGVSPPSSRPPPGQPGPRRDAVPSSFSFSPLPPFLFPSRCLAARRRARLRTL